MKQQTSSIAQIKITVISLLLFVESLILSTLIYRMVQTQNYFNPSLQNVVLIILLMILLLITYSLSIPGWGKTRQYALVTLPICAGIGFVASSVDVIYAALIIGISAILIINNVYSASMIRNELIHFNPRFMLQHAAKGELYAFSVLGAFLVFANLSSTNARFDVGKTVTDIAYPFLEKNLENNFSNQLNLLQGAFDAEQKLAQDYLNYINQDIKLNLDLKEEVNLDFRKNLENQINNMIAEYQEFVPSVIALIVFFTLNVFAAASYFLYSLISGPLMYMLRRFGFFTITKAMVEKEVVTF